MELTFSREDAADAMKSVSGAVGNSAMPILGNVLISTANDPLPGLLRSETNGRIYIAATDLEVGIRASIAGHISEGGAVTIPARKFAAMVKEMSDPTVHLTATSADRVSIDCGSAKFRLAGLPADEFPSLIPETDPEPQPELIGKKEDNEGLPFVSMDAKTLAVMIQQTAYAASREEVRYFLNGVHLSIKPEGETSSLVKMAATDGKRLAIAAAKAEGNTGSERQGIIPVKAAEHLRNMLLNSETVRISMNENRAIFDTGSTVTGNTVFATRLIEGDYPDYEKVIPSDNSIKLTICTQILLSIAKRVGVMANPKNPGLKIETTGDILKVSSSTPEFGEGFEETQIRKEGGDISISLNAHYLMDILKATDKAEVTLSMSDPLKPVLIKPVADDNYVCVIMPMRL